MARQYDAGGQESYLDLAGASAQAIANAEARYQAASAQAIANAGTRYQAASGMQQMGSLINRDSMFLIEEVTQLPAPLTSSGMIFNYSTTADMATNPSNYRAFARAFNNDQGDTPILAGQRRIVGQTTRSPSSTPAAGLNGTNTFAWTGQAWAGQTRYSYFNATSQFVSPLVESQVGYQPSNLTANGIGIDLWINFNFNLPKLWNCTLFYYDSPFVGAVLQSTNLCINNVFQYQTINDVFGNPIIITNQKPVRSTDINYNAGYSNLQLYFTIYGAVSPPPTGFGAIPAGVFQFNSAVREEWPRLLWTCV